MSFVTIWKRRLISDFIVKFELIIPFQPIWNVELCIQNRFKFVFGLQVKKILTNVLKSEQLFNALLNLYPALQYSTER